MPDADPLAATLAGIGAIEQAATPGPWTASEKHGMDIADEAWSEVKITAADGSDVAALYISHLLENYNSDEDLAFITAARTAVPRLLAALEAVLKMTHGVRIALSACGVSGPCSCGEHPVAWTLDPAKLREAITTALAGKEQDRD